MSRVEVTCPECGAVVGVRRNPYPTVDVVIRLEGGVVLIKRKNPPHGWALPGGFVDYGESFEEAARREAREETGLDVELDYLLGVYSDPERDPRQHNVSVVYAAIPLAGETPGAGSDAAEVGVFLKDELPELAFDHARILSDYFRAEVGISS